MNYFQLLTKNKYYIPAYQPFFLFYPSKSFQFGWVYLHVKGRVALLFFLHVCWNILKIYIQIFGFFSTSSSSLSMSSNFLFSYKSYTNTLTKNTTTALSILLQAMIFRGRQETVMPSICYSCIYTNIYITDARLFPGRIVDDCLLIVMLAYVHTPIGTTQALAEVTKQSAGIPSPMKSRPSYS